MSAVMKKFSPKRVMLDPLCIPKVFPVIFKVQLKRWNISVRAINVRHFLPPHSCEPRPPYLWHPEPSASPPGATHSHCAETNCGSLRNFATICGEQREGRELDRGRVTSEHRCIGGRLAAKPAPFTLNCVEDFDSLNFAGQANVVEAKQMMLLQQQNCSKYSFRSLTLRNIH